MYQSRTDTGSPLDRCIFLTAPKPGYAAFNLSGGYNQGHQKDFFSVRLIPSSLALPLPAVFGNGANFLRLFHIEVLHPA